MRDAACAEVGACCCTKLSPGAKAQVDRVSQALRAFSDAQQKTVRVSSLFALVGDGRWLRCGQSTTTYGVQVRRVFHFSWQPTDDPFHRAASRVVTWEGGEADDRQVLFPPWAVPVAAQSPAAGGGGKAPKSDDEADSGCFAAGTKRTFIDMSNASGAACVGQQQADISMDHSDVHDDDESDENVTEDPLLAEWLVDIV